MQIWGKMPLFIKNGQKVVLNSATADLSLFTVVFKQFLVHQLHKHVMAYQIPHQHI